MHIEELMRLVECMRQENASLRMHSVQVWASAFPACLQEIQQSTELTQETLLAADSFALFGDIADFEHQCSSYAFYNYLTQVQCALYSGNAQTAWQLIERVQVKLDQSGLLNQGLHSLWQYCMRVNAALLLLNSADDHSHQSKNARLSRFELEVSRLRKLPHRPLQLIADAYQLLVKAHRNQPEDAQHWNRIAAALRQQGLSLYANALDWHQGLFTPTPAGKQLSLDACERFSAAGFLDPRRLMNLIIPLPQSHA
jgi:hypothetical protein